MKGIVPHLWFDKEAREAAAFYATVFPDSGVTHTMTLKGTPSGDCDVVAFTVRKQPFLSISAGPYFKLNPSISFLVNYDPSQEKNPSENLDAAWAKLAAGGKVLMALDKYPWSERYGWVQDRFGVSWQLILTEPAGMERPQVMPSILFTGKVYGRAEEAVQHYLSVFKDAKTGGMMKYPAGAAPNREGTVMFADLKIGDLWLAVMDGAGEHAFAFNEAVSFMVNCETQAELDAYADKLSADRDAEQCGWVKDRFGVSWQIASARLNEMMRSGDQQAVNRVTQAFLPMKRFDLKTLEAAFRGS